MNAARELWDDEAPPESGVWPRRPGRPPALPLETLEPRPRFAPAVELGADPRIAVEAFTEAVLEVWGLFRVLQPLQGSWMLPGLESLGALVTTVAGWEETQAGTLTFRTLKRRWPELVPGAAAMDRLVGWMVDRICR